MTDDLKPCPFCGGKAERITLGDEEPANKSGDVITCQSCGASSHVEFGRKENLVYAWNRRATPTVQEAAKVRVKAAIAEQISEGIGAVLRKFCDSADAIRAREHLHKMPESDWNTLIDMLAEESASAALRAIAEINASDDD